MENLIIEGSHGDFFIPSINFDASSGILEIAGESYLEDTVDFYKPVLQWIRDYIAIKKPIILDVKLIYFNTSSSRSILDILYLIKDYQDDGGNITVNWHILNEDPEEMIEEVEDFMLDTELKINIIQKEEA